ncbi:glycosyl transferases group 1 family protein [Lysobacter antibioticus]|uniref:glycosyltransferase family 4 protein n=1 Tax=Lysobacter antibioticus TaxID=84531 RepID=UPI00071704FF|nr:glycosyltransferase family 4 protein [Lysobacter antibioticus]ALN63297.1 glycosyl transferases group 1 family protein [Lysobacter antibioticus]
MRILFLSDNFPPEGNAPATRTYEHAVRWVRAGHEVTVITCAPNFPEGKLFDGYRNAWRSVETVDGIRVVRVKTYITANEGFVKRTLDYLSFMAASVVAGLFEPRHDVVVATSPQFFCALGGWALARLRRRPFVFELRDLWPASITAVGAMKRSAAVRALERLEMFLYRSADAIVPVTHTFREELIQRGIAADKIHVVLNGVDLQRYASAARDEALSRQYDLDGRFVVGYLGTHGMAHGLEKVVDAAERLQHDPRIAFFFAGSGAERARVERLVAERGLSNVRMIPRQPKEMMPKLWSLCDISLIPLRNNPVFSGVIPSKLFEGMGMGIPALMSLPRGEATRIVETTDCGVCVPPEDAEAMAAAILALVEDPGRMRRLRDSSLAAAPSYSRDRQAALMTDALARLLDDDTADLARVAK